MRIDVPGPDAWGQLSELYRAALVAKAPQLSEPALNIQIYAGVGHAVNEITRSLSKLYTHKKTIAIVSGVDPTFNLVAVAFSQEGYVVKNISVAEAAQSSTWAPLMDELLLVLTCEDDPVTGRLYAFDSTSFVGQRVFRVNVSHEAYKWSPLKRPDPFTINIFSLSPDRALMVAGERCKIEPSIAPTLSWNVPAAKSELLVPALSIDPTRNLANEKAVKDFESNLPSGFQTYFANDAARVYDRVVIYHADFDGSAVIDELASTMQLPVAAPGANANFETTSACRWESPRFQDWLIQRGENENTTRGLVIISSELLDKGLRTHLETAAAKVARLQNG